MFLFASSSFAEVPVNPHFTPMSLMPRPFAASSAFEVAGIYWLPDYLGKNISRGSEDMGGGDIVKDDSDCMKHYNLYETCPSPKVSTGVVHPVAGMTCQKGCICPSEYQYTSSNCSGKYKLSGNSCDGKYSDCVCNDTFIYDASNCNGENKLGGEICNGKYNSCTIRPECTVSSKDCTYGCAEYNSCDRCTSCKTNPDCDVSDKSCTYGCAATNSCGKCTECKSCTPYSDETGCTDGTESCSDGCGGTRLCCKGHSHSYNCPAGYSSSNSWGSSALTASKTCSCGATSDTCYKAPACTPEDCVPSGYVGFNSCPEHGACDYCEPGCGQAYLYWLADGCDSGYKINAAGTGCVAIESCKYSTTKAQCDKECKYTGSQSCIKNGTTYYNGCGRDKCSGTQPYCSHGTCVECAEEAHCPGWKTCRNNRCVWDLDDNCDGNGGMESICNITSNSATICCCPRGKSGCPSSSCNCYSISY